MFNTYADFSKMSGLREIEAIFDLFKLKPKGYGEEGLQLEYEIANENGELVVILVFGFILGSGCLSINIRHHKSDITTIYTEKIASLAAFQDNYGQGVVISFNVAALKAKANNILRPFFKN